MGLFRDLLVWRLPSVGHRLSACVFVCFVYFVVPSPAKNLLAFFNRADLTDVKVYPPAVSLKTKQDRQSLVVQATYADGVTRDVSAQALLFI